MNKETITRAILPTLLAVGLGASSPQRTDDCTVSLYNQTEKLTCGTIRTDLGGSQFYQLEYGIRDFLPDDPFSQKYWKNIQLSGIRVVDNEHQTDPRYNCYGYAIATTWPDSGIDNQYWINPYGAFEIFRNLTETIYENSPITTISDTKIGDIIIIVSEDTELTQRDGSPYFYPNHAMIITGFTQNGEIETISKLDDNHLVEGTLEQLIKFYRLDYVDLPHITTERVTVLRPLPDSQLHLDRSE